MGRSAGHPRAHPGVLISPEGPCGNRLRGGGRRPDRRSGRPSARDHRVCRRGRRPGGGAARGLPDRAAAPGEFHQSAPVRRCHAEVCHGFVSVFAAGAHALGGGGVHGTFAADLCVRPGACRGHRRRNLGRSGRPGPVVALGGALGRGPGYWLGAGATAPGKGPREPERVGGRRNSCTTAHSDREGPASAHGHRVLSLP